MSDIDLDAIREHHAFVAEKTPGPWRWCGQDDGHGGQVYLATVNHGRIYVMGFARRGFSGAQPEFPVFEEGGYGHLAKASEGLIVREAEYRRDIANIDNLHAEYLKRAPEYIGALLAEVDRLRHDLDRAFSMETTAGVSS